MKYNFYCVVISGFLLATLLVGCTQREVRVERDEAKLSDVELFGYILDGLGERGDPLREKFEEKTVSVFLDLKKIPFQTPPNPRLLLESYQAKNRERLPHEESAEVSVQNESQKERVSLSVLTYNVALLKAKIFGFIPYAESPYLEERREGLPEFIFEKDFDILFLQEVWEEEDRLWFQEMGESRGYFVQSGPRTRSNDGCLTLVKKSILKEGGFFKEEAILYERSDKKEFWPGPGVKRGFLYLAFEHPSLGMIHLYNTHQSPWYNKWKLRNSQVRQLSLHSQQYAKGEELVFLGGDMNAGSYYSDDTWTTPKGKEYTEWWSNTLSYPLFHYYGDFLDLFLMGKERDEALLDIEWGREVGNRGGVLRKTVSEDSEWCRKNGGVNFTASDCNLLYFLQYGEEEFPARMDLLFVRDRGKRVYVEESSVLFQEPFFEKDGVQFPASDHYGVGVSLSISKS